MGSCAALVPLTAALRNRWLPLAYIVGLSALEGSFCLGEVVSLEGRRTADLNVQA